MSEELALDLSQGRPRPILKALHARLRPRASGWGWGLGAGSLGGFRGEARIENRCCLPHDGEGINKEGLAGRQGKDLVGALRSAGGPCTPHSRVCTCSHVHASAHMHAPSEGPTLAHSRCHQRSHPHPLFSPR